MLVNTSRGEIVHLPSLIQVTLHLPIVYAALLFCFDKRHMFDRRFNPSSMGGGGDRPCDAKLS